MHRTKLPSFLQLISTKGNFDSKGSVCVYICLVDILKRMSLTVQRAVTTPGKDEVERRAKGGHEGEAVR